MSFHMSCLGFFVCLLGFSHPEKKRSIIDLIKKSTHKVNVSEY